MNNSNFFWRLIKVVLLGSIVTIISPLLVVVAMVMYLFNINFPDTPAQKRAKVLAKEDSSDLADLCYRMTVLYTEIPYSDVLMVERISRTLKEKHYGTTGI